jgi:hypothetical protein
MARATFEEIVELLGDERIDEAFIERVANVGASIDEVGEAVDDLEYERRYGEPREPSSPLVEEVRSILEELPAERSFAEPESEPEAAEENEGLTVIEPDDLAERT